MLQGNANCPATKTVTGITKVANELYLSCQQLCGKALTWGLMYCRCKSYQSSSKITKIKGVPHDTNKQLFTKVVIRTGKPRT